MNSLVCYFSNMNYSDDTEGRLFIVCLSLLEKEEQFHRLISVMVETWKYFKHFPISTSCTLITPPSHSTSDLGLVIFTCHDNIPHGVRFRSNHLRRGVSRAERTSSLAKEYGGLEVENVKLQKLEELHLWTHPST